MIKIVDVVHHYGVKPILRNINLHVASGEVVALMGPNGSGKSTLLALMAGALHPLQGSVEINGLRRRSSRETELAIRRQVVYLPAEPWIPLTITGRAWLLGVGRVWGVREQRLMDHLDALLGLFDLKEQADADASSYSTGQRKKLALAGALITEAPVMLLDEPFAGGLDPAGILALRRVLARRAHGDEFTIVIATPVPELVEELADRVAILRDGRIAACDSVAGLRAMVGREASLAEIYAQVTNPAVSQQIDHYLAGVS